MSLEALAEKTWKTQRVLLIPLLVLGALVVVGGLASGLPFLSGFGIALLCGGGFGLWRLRVKDAAFKALLADPRRVVQVVPIVQTVQGLVTHFPVVVVADDGTPYRIGTWARSVPEALAPFLERFPHAAGLDKDRVFAPDDGFGVRFKMVGVMLGSLLVGLVVAGLLVLPRALSSYAASSVAYERQAKRNQVEAQALLAVSKVEVDAPWTACSVDSLEPALPVLLDGAQSKTWSSKRDGFLSKDFALSLSTATELHVFRTSFLEKWFDAMAGSRSYSSTSTPEPTKRALGVVGVRRGDALTLRVYDLDDGSVRCEGTTPVAPTKDSTFEEDRALAAAVMRPFCAQLPRDACPPGNDAPVAAVPAPAPTPAPKSKPAAPKPGTLDRESILATVRTATPRSRACYESALRKQPNLKGTLTVTFVIGSDGRVTSAQGSGFPDATVTECVGKVFRVLRFPAPADGKVTPVKYPLTFQPQS